MLGPKVRLRKKIDLLQDEPLVQGDQTLCLFRGQLIGNDGTNVVRGKGDSFLPRMPLLAADLAFVSSPTSSLLLGLDNVTGRRLGRVGGVPLPASDLVLELLVVRSSLSDVTLELGIGLLQGQDLGAKQIVLQAQLRYRDILVYHRQGYTGLPSFAPVENPCFTKFFSPHSVNGYHTGN